MDTSLLAGRFALVVVFPLLIAVAPLFLFLIVSHRKSVARSVSRVALTAISSTLIGLCTPFFAFWVSAAGMTIGMPKNGPNCITGVTLFLLIGYLSTAITLLVGAIFTVQVFISQREQLV